MAVYVDDMYKYARGRLRGMKMSHMIADTDLELHNFANKIGLKKEWFQGDHYDVALVSRKKAVQLGAIEVGQKQIAAMVARKREEGICGVPEEALKWYSAYRKAKKEL